MHAIRAHRFADMLTLSRALVAVGMIWVGLTSGISGVGLIAWLLMIAWTSDSLDGPIARRVAPDESSLIGDLDLAFDITVSLGLLGYAVVAGFIPSLAALGYLLAWAIIFLRWGFARSLGMLIQAPIYGLFVLLALSRSPTAGAALLAWIGMVVIVTWPRFPNEVIPGFLKGMRRLGGQD